MIRDPIIIPADKNYLGEYLKELPVNCLFNKQKVGCGGTTIAINSNKSYVIAVPYTHMIYNKLEQHKNIFAINGYISLKKLDKYLSDFESPKFMVCYDSIEKLDSLIDISKFTLLVDELHILTADYVFRNQAIRKVLDNFRKYNEYCFMSATPISEEFLLDELQDIDTIEAKWINYKKPSVTPIRCSNNVNDTVIELIYEHLIGTKEGNAYLFVNSVEFIKAIVKECKLTDDDTRAIWSSNNSTETGLIRGSPLNKPKKINLLTKTCFEGCDFYDTEGKTYVISEGKRSTTLLDISVSIPQIAGRIRDTKYCNEIYHIYSNTRYSNITYDEFKYKTEIASENAKICVAAYNELPEIAKNGIHEQPDSYIRKKNNVFSYDANFLKLDIRNFKIINHTYASSKNMEKEYYENGIILNPEIKTNYSVTRMDLLKKTLKETMVEIENDPFNYELQKAAFVRYKWLKEAISKIGLDGIKENKYHIGNIQRKLIIRTDDDNIIKIFKMLNTKVKIQPGLFLNLMQLKLMFADIYDELGIYKKPKASDLLKYYDAKLSAKNVKGRTENGYTIIRKKIVFD